MAVAMPTKEGPLTGVQKCAVVCMVLGRDMAAKIMTQLPAIEVESLAREIALNRSIKADVVHDVLTEFRGIFQAVESVAQGGLDYAKDLLDQAVGPQRARSILERIREQIADTGLRRLKRAAPEVLNNALRGEHPQTMALILAHLEPRQASSVLTTMDQALAGDVLYRIARMDKISPEMLALVEAGLASKTDLTLSQEMTLTGGPDTVAKMLNFTGGSVEKVLLEAIDQRDAEIATQIKNLMFVFEDLRRLDSRAMQRLLREIDGKELAVALKAATEELKQHILSNMSERASGALLEEIEFLGPVKVRDVEAAQGRIIETMRNLEDAGEIVVGGRGGDDDVIA